jgi:hypothetical protein
MCYITPIILAAPPNGWPDRVYKENKYSPVSISFNISYVYNVYLGEGPIFPP